jgi:hypothetical protein
MLITLQIPGDKSEYKKCVLNLNQNTKLLNINRIVYDLNEKIYLRLLSCKDVKDEECASHGNRNDSQPIKKICDETLDFSYIYYQINNSHYLAVFIPSLSIEKYSENTQELMQIITWLNLQDKKFTFEIFHYGEPFNQLRSSTIKKNFSNEIKNSVEHKLYKTGEEICFMKRLEQCETTLIFPKDKLGRLLAS